MRGGSAWTESSRSFPKKVKLVWKLKDEWELPT